MLHYRGVVDKNLNASDESLGQCLNLILLKEIESTEIEYKLARKYRDLITREWERNHCLSWNPILRQAIFNLLKNFVNDEA